MEPFRVALILQILSMAMALVWVAIGRSESGDVNTTLAPTSKLSVTCNTTGVDGFGYRMVTVTVSTANGAPSTVDRELYVTVEPNNYSVRDAPRVEEPITLAVGDTSASAVFYFPGSGAMWQTVAVTARENGRQLNDLHAFAGVTRSSWQTDENLSKILFIDKDTPLAKQRYPLIATTSSTLPDFTGMISQDLGSDGQLLSFSGPTAGNDATILGATRTTNHVNLSPFEELPDEWVGLTQYDVCVIEMADLELLFKAHPEKARALSSWVQGGGNLLVYGYDSATKTAETIDYLFGPNQTLAPEAIRDWRLIRPSRGNAVSHFVDNGNANWRTRSVASSSATPSPPVASPQPPVVSPTPPEPVLVRRMGLGYVIGLANKNPFPGNRRDWDALFSVVPDDSLVFARRYGFSPTGTNRDFWRFLAPGVGAPPVFFFVVLITAYSILIGPVNYLFLRHRKRLILLPATVVFGAIATTLALLSYSIISDGTVSKVRVRSFTEIDASGAFTSISRQAYFAPFPPSEGLIFPKTAAVFVYQSESQPMGRVFGSASRLTATAFRMRKDSQQFAQGYLLSRRLSQFIVVNPSVTDAKMAITVQGPKLIARNQLGTEVTQLVIRDEKGAYYVASQLGVGETVSLEPITDDGQTQAISKAIVERNLEFPADLDLSSNGLFDWSAMRSTNEGDDSSGLLERRIQEIASQLRGENRGPERQATIDDKAITPQPGIPNRSYIAITRQVPSGEDGVRLTPIGLKEPEIIDDLHLVRGRW